MHVLVVDGMAVPLDRDDAQWLEELIRATCVDASHRPRDIDAVACLQLADMLADEHPGRRLEPIALTLPQARGLTAHVLSPSIAQERGLQTFYDVLRQFTSDNA